MRVVLDTNVLLSALLSPHGAADFIYRAWQKDRFDLVTSALQINELRRASRYAKFKDVLQPHLEIEGKQGGQPFKKVTNMRMVKTSSGWTMAL